MRLAEFDIESTVETKRAPRDNATGKVFTDFFLLSRNVGKEHAILWFQSTSAVPYYDHFDRRFPRPFQPCPHCSDRNNRWDACPYFLARKEESGRDWWPSEKWAFKVTGEHIVIKDGEEKTFKLGSRIWSVGKDTYNEIRSKHKEQKQRCVCVVGAVVHLAWLCRECGDEVGWTDDDAARGTPAGCKCNWRGSPAEKVACTKKCARPARRSLLDCSWRVEMVKTGERIDAVTKKPVPKIEYRITVADFDSMPEELRSLIPLDPNEAIKFPTMEELLAWAGYLGDKPAVETATTSLDDVPF